MNMKMEQKDNHKFTKSDVVCRLEQIKDKTLLQVDNKGVLDSYEQKKEKGIVGRIIEQCVFKYPSDNNPDADLLIDEEKVELKTTGVIEKKKGAGEYVAKEKLSIAAVSIYKLSRQKFCTSHFWKKMEHLLMVFYLYKKRESNQSLVGQYKHFKFIDYAFFSPTKSEAEELENDWQKIHDFVEKIIDEEKNERDEEKKKKNIKDSYIQNHGKIRREGLTYLTLAPVYPPRFQLKKDYVTAIVQRSLNQEKNGDALKDFPKMDSLSDVWDELSHIAKKYEGWSLSEIAKDKDVHINGGGSKNVAEQVLIKLFSEKCEAKKLNQIETFYSKSIIAKTVVYKRCFRKKIDAGWRLSEDMKMLPVDFEDLLKKKIVRENMSDELEELEEIKKIDEFRYEDSNVYEFFSQHEFICIIFERPSEKSPLKDNIFRGFKRLSFPQEYINGDGENTLQSLWNDSRNKIFKKTLTEVSYQRNGKTYTAPNFLKASENVFFFRGSAPDSSEKNKKERIPGIDIKMLPQYLWVSRRLIYQLLESQNYL